MPHKNEYLFFKWMILTQRNGIRDDKFEKFFLKKKRENVNKIKHKTTRIYDEFLQEPQLMLCTKGDGKINAIFMIIYIGKEEGGLFSFLAGTSCC